MTSLCHTDELSGNAAQSKHARGWESFLAMVDAVPVLSNAPTHTFQVGYAQGHTQPDRCHQSAAFEYLTTMWTHELAVCAHELMTRNGKVQLHSVLQQLMMDSTLVDIERTAKGSAPALFIQCWFCGRVVDRLLRLLQHTLYSYITRNATYQQTDGLDLQQPQPLEERLAQACLRCLLAHDDRSQLAVVAHQDDLLGPEHQRDEALALRGLGALVDQHLRSTRGTPTSEEL